MATTDARTRWRRANLGGWLVFTLCAGVAGARALSADVPPPPRRLDASERAELGRAAAALEPGWRVRSFHAFPGDRWSQDDDFGNSERRWVSHAAQQRGVPPTDVFRAIDENLRTEPVLPPRKATASPSKPRPFYD